MTPEERAAGIEVHAVKGTVNLLGGWDADEDRLRQSIAAAIDAAVVEEKKRVLSNDYARFHMHAMQPGTWEYDALEDAKETAAELEREACLDIARARGEQWEAEQRRAGVSEHSYALSIKIQAASEIIGEIMDARQ